MRAQPNSTSLPSMSVFQAYLRKCHSFSRWERACITALEQPQNVTHFHTPTKRHTFSHIFTLQPPIPSSSLTASPPSQTQSKSSTVQRLKRARDASHTTPLTPVCLCHSPVGMSIVIPEGCVTKLYQRGLGFCCRRQHGCTINFFLHHVPRAIRSYAVVEDGDGVRFIAERFERGFVFELIPRGCVYMRRG